MITRSLLITRASDTATTMLLNLVMSAHHCFLTPPAENTKLPVATTMSVGSGRVRLIEMGPTRESEARNGLTRSEEQGPSNAAEARVSTVRN